jgi:large conductance mechanosensitive channel
MGLTLAEARKLGPVFAWGSFVTAVINFLILAFVIFLLVKAMNRLKRKTEAPPPPPPPGPTPTEQLLMEIRDALKK